MLFKKALLLAAALVGASLAQDTDATTTNTVVSTSFIPDNDAACTASYVSLIQAAPTAPGDLAAAITSWVAGAEQSPAAGGGMGGAGVGNPPALISEACSFSAQLPQSLQAEFDTYATQVISYISASSSAIDALITSCVATGKAGDSYTSLVNSLAAHTGPLCQATGGAGGATNNTGTMTTSPTTTTTIAGGTGATTTTGETGGTTTEAHTGGTTTTEEGRTTAVHTGAAALPTAVIGGAAAAAGLLGAAILL